MHAQVSDDGFDTNKVDLLKMVRIIRLVKLLKIMRVLKLQQRFAELTDRFPILIYQSGVIKAIRLLIIVGYFAHGADLRLNLRPDSALGLRCAGSMPARKL